MILKMFRFVKLRLRFPVCNVQTGKVKWSLAYYAHKEGICIVRTRNLAQYEITESHTKTHEMLLSSFCYGTVHAATVCVFFYLK
jgi:hypothetical protein